jgi:hypothetical protein
MSLLGLDLQGFNLASNNCVAYCYADEAGGLSSPHVGCRMWGYSGPKNRILRKLAFTIEFGHNTCVVV